MRHHILIIFFAFCFALGFVTSTFAQNDLSNVYAIVGTTIYNKQSLVVFTKPEEFFADSGKTSFYGLQYDVQTSLPSGLRYVDGRRLTLSDYNKIGVPFIFEDGSSSDITITTVNTIPSSTNEASQATARCNDGTYGIPLSVQCSEHGGVAQWLTTNVRRIDFKNYIYDYNDAPIVVRNGKWKGKNLGEYFSVDKIVYGDVTDDGEEEAIVVTRSSGGGSGQFSGAIVYSLVNKGLVALKVYPGDGTGPYHGLPGGDRASGGIFDVEIKGGAIYLYKYAPDDQNPALCCPVYIDTYVFRWNGNSLVSDGQRKQRRLKPVEPAKIEPVTAAGYIDVIEITGSGCRIRFISGDKSYTGIISFERLSALAGRRIRSYEDALAFFEGRQINITLSGITSSSDGGSIGSFAGISRMTMPSPTTIKTQQRWSERTTATETIIDLSTDILFDFNKSTINPSAVPSLIKLARLLRQSNSNNIQLDGFTDSIGTDENNFDLSLRRSKAVKQWLVSNGGIDTGRITTVGHGKNQPVAPNSNADGSDNPTGRQKNRRVEIRIPRT